VDDYITAFYLSTWESAAVEGGMSGFGEGIRASAREGNKVGEGIAGFTGISGNPSEIIYHLPIPPSPYCRVYAAEPEEVSRVIAAILPALGNAVKTSDETNGIFTTEPIERRHLMARWRDSYEISVVGEAPKRTVVRILRKLYISRMRGEFSQGLSVGHNEAWIMTQIADKLRESGNAQVNGLGRE
jgi:hypothetical protein